MNSKRVLVTGASKGIGRAICERLTADGYAVVGVARTPPPADLPAGMVFHAVDLADNEAVNRFLAGEAAQQPFYGLVNNVGMVPVGNLETVSAEALYRAVQLNIEVALRFTQALVPGMRAQGIGRVLNMASRAALGKTERSIYSMTKAGLIGMTRTWALELAPAGITVNAIAPGPIETDFFAGANDAERTRALLASIPVNRMGRPEDVAHAVAYFMDERCGFVTGQTHFVCGGMTVGNA
ncbi:SDR family oxidoreductase [Bordetella avium]|uniref:SDR family oxidoreductase n=2 Tax=Bordetella avium TaxID=521 RepID=UPI000E678EB8|nr:SDR family oxidoreductase [Bordetella avium]RIQ41342.1 SDR family oxidoreductase [Bordetella avium]RIQ45870.1 SDR family oxidoreductase [Bordetella avium]RIQ46797.1 SDR family oxidoreductase [Bordetella avium]RIQ76455.1 SDR family oxidoreductase [Bordetella avium]